MENEKNREKQMKLKAVSSKTIKRINKCLAKLTKIKIEKIQITSIRNETGNWTTIQKDKRIQWKTQHTHLTTWDELGQIP